MLASLSLSANPRLKGIVVFLAAACLVAGSYVRYAIAQAQAEFRYSQCVESANCSNCLSEVLWDPNDCNQNGNPGWCCSTFTSSPAGPNYAMCVYNSGGNMACLDQGATVNQCTNGYIYTCRCAKWDGAAWDCSNMSCPDASANCTGTPDYKNGYFNEVNSCVQE
jgi:hypothetical protein